jgi:RimJ/RimL family protein N-acetyltransferase
MTTLETERLILRAFTDADRDAFAALNADATVMRWVPAPLDHATSNLMVDKCIENATRDRFSFGAVEVKGCGFIGMCGLSAPGYETRFTPCIEIG